MNNHQPVEESAARCELRFTDLEPAIDLTEIGFNTTNDLEPLDEVVGQKRALRALEFGLGVRHRGYNVFVSGMTGTGKKQLVQKLLEARASREATPEDWVYLHNFDEIDRPLALRLPSGHGARLRNSLEQVIDRLRHDLPAVLKAKDFDAERERLAAKFEERSETLFNQLVERARDLNMVIHRLPTGVIVFVPIKDDKRLEREDVEKLDAGERAEIEKHQKELSELASDLMAKQQELSHELRHEVQSIVRGFAQRIVEPLIARVKNDHPDVQLGAWLDRVQVHMLEHLDRLQEDSKEPATDLPSALQTAMEHSDRWLEYRVNVVADHSHAPGAPVVVEISPTYKNLFGTIEHDVNLFGRVSTDFTRIKPGSLLRASGGYLVLDLEDALTEPLVWRQLKRTLKSGQLLTDVYEPLTFLSTTALKPQPIPIDTKVVALGSPELYYLLQLLDDEFRELFKVRADFGPETSRNLEGHRAYARFIAKQVGMENLPAFDAAAVGEVIRFGVREAEHQDKLSVEFGVIADLVREAGHWARVAGASTVSSEHVRQALEERVYRSGRIAAKIREMIDEGVLRISIDGSRVAQVNGLSIWDMGDYRFGRPCRVTASVGVGQEGLVNIERESDLSGSSHDKGVLILEGYLHNRYAAQHPLALSAHLTFEQSYGKVDGDSASVAELCCLLSALADVPVRQDIAVTGSINQHGEIQAVGGVNEKIEGFFDICRLKGLTGSQGVCIPRSNVRHLVLRPDVIEAVREKRFHIWAIDVLDEAIELLMGKAAGAVNREGTLHYLVDQRLQEILAVLEERTAPVSTPHVRLAPAIATKPSLPRLPGEDN